MIWLGIACAIGLFLLGVGYARLGDAEKRHRDRLLDEADRQIAAMNALRRIHTNSHN